MTKAQPVIWDTARLRLEPVAEQHLDGLYAMDRLPEVMRDVTGAPATFEQTAAWVASA